MVPGRLQAVVFGRQRAKRRMTGLQGDRRIARTEPCFVEVVRLGGQRRARLDQGLSHLAGRRLAARDVAVHGVDELGDARVALRDLELALGFSTRSRSVCKLQLSALDFPTAVQSAFRIGR